MQRPSKALKKRVGPQPKRALKQAKGIASGKFTKHGAVSSTSKKPKKPHVPSTESRAKGHRNGGSNFVDTAKALALADEVGRAAVADTVEKVLACRQKVQRKAASMEAREEKAQRRREIKAHLREKARAALTRTNAAIPKQPKAKSKIKPSASIVLVPGGVQVSPAASRKHSRGDSSTEPTDNMAREKRARRRKPDARQFD